MLHGHLEKEEKKKKYFVLMFAIYNASEEHDRNWYIHFPAILALKISLTVTNQQSSLCEMATGNYETPFWADLLF